MKGRLSDTVLKILRSPLGKEQLRYALLERKESVIRLDDGSKYTVKFNK